jgi:hypothetical protein
VNEEMLLSKFLKTKKSINGTTIEKTVDICLKSDDEGSQYSEESNCKHSIQRVSKLEAINLDETYFMEYEDSEEQNSFNAAISELVPELLNSG